MYGHFIHFRDSSMCFPSSLHQTDKHRALRIRRPSRACAQTHRNHKEREDNVHFVLLRQVSDTNDVELEVIAGPEGGDAPDEGSEELVGVGNLRLVSVGVADRYESIENRLETIR